MGAFVSPRGRDASNLFPIMARSDTDAPTLGRDMLSAIHAGAPEKKRISPLILPLFCRRNHVSFRNYVQTSGARECLKSAGMLRV
jgi:hypothetical protein